MLSTESRIRELYFDILARMDAVQPISADDFKRVCEAKTSGTSRPSPPETQAGDSPNQFQTQAGGSPNHFRPLALNIVLLVVGAISVFGFLLFAAVLGVVGMVAARDVFVTGSIVRDGVLLMALWIMCGATIICLFWPYYLVYLNICENYPRYSVREACGGMFVAIGISGGCVALYQWFGPAVVGGGLGILTQVADSASKLRGLQAWLLGFGLLYLGSLFVGCVSKLGEAFTGLWSSAARRSHLKWIGV